MLETGDVKEISDVLNVFLTVFGVVFKVIWFKRKLRKVEEMKLSIAEVLNFQATTKRIKLKASVKQITKVNKFFLCSAFVACSAAILQFCFTNSNKRLPYETWFYFDFKSNDTLLWCLAAYQYAVSIYGAFCNYSFDIIPIILICLATAAFEELSEAISSLPNQGKNFENSGKLEDCVKQHIKIKAFVKEISDQLSFFFLLQAFLSAVILCTSAFLLTTVILLRNLP